MPIATQAVQTVVFIVKAETNADGETVKRALGIGFIVEISAEDNKNLLCYYAVTAAHCVRGVRNTMIRSAFIGRTGRRMIVTLTAGFITRQRT